MNKIKQYLIIPFSFFCVLTISCEDEAGLSEEEILELATTSDNVRIRVVERNEDRPVVGATVIIQASDGEVSSTTDDGGVANFSGLDQGEYIVIVQKEGYEKVTDEISIFESGRAGSEDIVLSMYSFDKVAKIQGTVSIQTDLTTEEPEVVEGITINVLENDQLIASAITDNDGSFNLEVPTSESGRNVLLTFPTLSLNQTIAIRGESGVEVRTAVGTLFNPFEPAQALSNTANIIISLPSPTWSSGRQGYVESIVVESGVITEVELSDTGFGYLNGNSMSVSSPDGGSGASISYTTVVDFSDECNFPRYYQLNGVIISDGGTGYPDYEPNQNVTTEHPSGFRWDVRGCNPIDGSRTFRIRADEVYDIDVNYGTGTITGDIQ